MADPAGAGAEPRIETSYVTELTLLLDDFGHDDDRDRKYTILCVAKALHNDFGTDFKIVDRDGVRWVYDPTAKVGGDVVKVAE